MENGAPPLPSALARCDRPAFLRVAQGGELADVSVPESEDPTAVDRAHSRPKYYHSRPKYYYVLLGA